jgi:hypothetical protein
MREIRVVTPDGYVWFVRLRWAWRWVPWTPLLAAAAARRERARQARKRKRSPDDYPLGADADVGTLESQLETSIVAMLVMSVAGPLLWVIAVVLIVAPIVWFPGWGRWLVHHSGELAAAVGVLLAAVAVALAGRPWLVEAEPLALNKPGRAWRVRGWRRAVRCAHEVAASIKEGRVDVEPRDAVPVEQR